MSKDKNKTTAAAPEATTALATQGTQEIGEALDFGEDAGQGFENQGAADNLIPMWIVLQDLSPMVKERKANAGDLYNTVTEDTIPGKTGVVMVPFLTEHAFVQWVSRKKGGGFKAKHAPTDTIVLEAIKRHAARPDAEFGKYTVSDEKDADELQETFYIYGAFWTREGRSLGYGLIPCKSMMIKPYKKLSTRLRSFLVPRKDATGKVVGQVNPPLYANQVLVTSVQEKNTKGEFYNIAFGALEGDMVKSLVARGSERYEVAKNGYQMVKAGLAKMDYAGAEKAGDAGGGDSEAAPF